MSSRVKKTSPVKVDTASQALDVKLVTEDGSAVITVPPSGKWKSKALSALISGDFEGWTEKTLLPSDRKVWVDLDPTIDDVKAFMERWESGAGVSVGESQALPSS